MQCYGPGKSLLAGRIIHISHDVQLQVTRASCVECSYSPLTFG